jgi:hypothetical protein
MPVPIAKPTANAATGGSKSASVNPAAAAAGGISAGTPGGIGGSRTDGGINWGGEGAKLLAPKPVPVGGASGGSVEGGGTALPPTGGAGNNGGKVATDIDV